MLYRILEISLALMLMGSTMVSAEAENTQAGDCVRIKTSEVVEAIEQKEVDGNVVSVHSDPVTCFLGIEP